MAHTSKNNTAIEVLHQNIAGATCHSLHDTAQPLTVLQGVLELTLLRASTVAEYSQSVERALEELRRVVGCLAEVRELVRLHEPASDVTTLAASTALQFVIDQFRSRFEDAGAQLVSQKPADGADLLKTSQNRISKVVSLIFWNALSCVSRGDRVQLGIEADLSTVKICVEISNHPSKQVVPIAPKVPGVVTRRWELTQALLASLGGELEFSQAPFSAIIRLPRAMSASSKGGSEHTKGAGAHV